MVPQLAPGLILPAYREHARTGRGYPAPSQPRVDGSGKGFERFPLAIVTEGQSDKLCLKSAVNYFLSTPLTQAQKAAIKHQRGLFTGSN
jgi:hypothetical protein